MEREVGLKARARMGPGARGRRGPKSQPCLPADRRMTPRLEETDHKQALLRERSEHGSNSYMQIG
eukprot:CAMPEP_0170411752 /NCGR_PEP_ID=MMETSP0117_2-20130122/30588_1 /TAXON_ID=400756 /ORGANISM="Durinskia baltica, Strain CSIRO CS-38" /LENGTH=64 /DNA_ID=CAMNT_0010669367 /DNA_START=72 /DNA_END=263 /DNA_ORIENTATION=-